MNLRFNRPFSLSSHPLCPVPIPRSMETHLWHVIPDEVKEPSLLSRYMEILSPCEKQSVLQFKEDELRKRALLARALVRTTIARYQTNSYVDPSFIKFTKNLYGKPEVDWQYASDRSSPPLHFNISHTSSLIACGVTNSVPIGIDVEEKERKIKNEIVSFARRFFYPLEVEYLVNILDPEVQRQEFLKLWTLKEAYVKALGRGFSSSPFSTFRIHLKAPPTNMSDSWHATVASEIVVESEDVPMSKWQFALMDLADTHYMAICREKDTNLAESGMGLRVWKTVPLLKDTCMSGTHYVVTLGGIVKQLNAF